MDLFEREFFVYRITSGHQRVKVNNKTLKIITPTPDILYECQEVYMETLYQSMLNGVATENDINLVLRSRGLWSDYDENQYSVVLPKHIDYWKKEVYNNFKNKKECDRIKIYLNAARNGYSELHARKHMFDHFTQHGLATFSKWQRLIELTTVNMDGSPYDWSDIGINGILEQISSGAISETIIREISRTEPWRGVWSAGGKTRNIFSCPSSLMSEDQRRLINWSVQYDNIREFPDAPSDDVFNDDDAFDGWMIIKSEEIERERVNKSLKERTKNSSMEAPEVFMIMQPEDKEDPAKFIQNVYGMNDPTSRYIVNNRINTIKSLGNVTDLAFADVQQNINRGIGNIIKGHK